MVHLINNKHGIFIVFLLFLLRKVKGMNVYKKNDNIFLKEIIVSVFKSLFMDIQLVFHFSLSYC